MRNSLAWVFCCAWAIGGCGKLQQSSACSVDGECPLHQLCEAGACVSGCLGPSDCPGATCGAHGRCESVNGGDASTGGDLAGGDLAGADLASRDLSSSDLANADLSSPPDLATLADLATPADAWICVGTCPDAALEPNNTAATATTESDSVTLPNLAICPPNDVDYFKVTASHKGTLTATLTNGPCGPAVDVEVLASDGTTVLGASTATANGAKASASVTPHQVCYVRVQAHTAGAQNWYALTIANLGS